MSVLRGDPLGRFVRVGEHEVVVGRGNAADLVLGDPTVSWAHARLYRRADRVFVEDLGSKNGTFVRGQRISEPTEVTDGDRIRVGGQTILKLYLADAMEEEAATRLYESTVRDAVTSVHNRRYLEERLEGELSFGARHGDALALLLIDVDHFKDVNDHHGHHVGDGVLRVVATAIQRILRPEDLFARYGGDEFVVLARRMTRKNALILAERIRAHVAALDFPVHLQKPITVSVGLSVLEPRHRPCTPESALAEADEAMYEAKHRGRNCVVAHRT